MRKKISRKELRTASRGAWKSGGLSANQIKRKYKSALFGHSDIYGMPSGKKRYVVGRGRTEVGFKKLGEARSFGKLTKRKVATVWRN